MTKTPLRKKGKSTRSKAKQLALKNYSEYIRLRDSDEEGYGSCFTCDKDTYWRTGHCGHFIQGRHSAVLFLETNAHLQCPQCNIFKHGNLVEYTRRMIEKYGLETVDMLRELDREIDKKTTDDLLEIARVFKQKAEGL